MQVVVAVKFLLSTKQSDEAYQTFHKEVASMCALNHPHIVKLYGIMLDSPVALVSVLMVGGGGGEEERGKWDGVEDVFAFCYFFSLL